MQTTKVFKSGNSPWQLFKKSLTEFTDDYFNDGRNQPKIQKRG
jgi:hypothetical protein